MGTRGYAFIIFSSSFALGILFMHLSSLRPALFISALLLLLVSLKILRCR